MSTVSCPAALISGPDLVLMADTLPTLAANIARRVAARPDGLIRSVQANENVRQETFRELWRRSGAIAAALEAASVGEGRLVVLIQRDVLEYLPAFWACLRAGAIAVPLAAIATSAAADDLAAVLDKLDRPAILCDGRSPAVDRVIALLPNAVLIDTMRAAPDGRPGEHAEAEMPCLVATSGSTGQVKLVATKTAAWLHRCYSQNYSAAGLDSHGLNLFPFDSLGGYRALFLSFASWTQLPSRALASCPSLVLDAVARFKITSFQTTNSMAALLADADDVERDFAALTHVGLGGEAVTQLVATALRDKLIRWGAPPNVVGAGYGTTETSFLLVGVDPTTAPLDEAGAIRLGGCAAGNAIRIVDDDGRVLCEGEVGHVEVSAPLTMFSHYWGEPEFSAAALTADGWWQTGDLGTIEAGSFAFRGRSKQTLVIGARKFSLSDIDTHLQRDVTKQCQTISFVARDAGSVTDGLGIAVLRETEANVDEGLAERIRASVVRRYGFAPVAMLELPGAAVPMTATGKIDRAALTRHPALVPWGMSREMVGRRDQELAALWREALDLPDKFDPHLTFEALGGNSLRLATLLAGIESKLRTRISLPAFFAAPTFDNLVQLAAAAPVRAAAEADDVAWALPVAIQRGIQSYVEGWQGARVTSDRLLLGRNLSGSRPPIFGVFNAPEEADNLAEALGADQPLYAFRSAHEVGVHSEDLLQQIALRYVHDIESVAPLGPIYLLGQCQGGSIALAIAQHLLRRRRDVPLLALADWALDGAAYPGRVLLLYGRDSVMHPKHRYIDASLAWKRLFSDHAFVELWGGYGTLYARENVASIAAELTRYCALASGRPPRLPPSRGYVLEVAGRAPWTMRPGQAVRLHLRLTNRGDLALSTDMSGVMLAGRWMENGAEVWGSPQPRTRLDDIALQASSDCEVVVIAPIHAGTYLLALDLVEEGHKRLHACTPQNWPNQVFVI